MRIRLLRVFFIGFGLVTFGPGLAQDSGTTTGSGSAEESMIVKDAMEVSGELIKKAAVGTEKAWEATREGTRKAAEYSKEKAGQAWEATTESTSEAVEWTQEKAGQGWDKTKDISEKAWDATSEAASDAGDAVKEGYEVVKDKAKDAVD